ncbi:MAG: SiaB family protein kinase [Raineya sp.]
MNMDSQTFLDENLRMYEKGTLMYYRGVFSYPVIVELSQHIRNDINLSPSFREKVFFIFVELAQNVSSYSQEQVSVTQNQKNVGIGSFHLLENSEFIYINTTNPIKQEQLESLQKRIEKINQLDRKGLRALKMNFREQAIDAHSNSGNVGLVEVALKSGNPIETKIAKADKHLISITAKLRKY